MEHMKNAGYLKFVARHLGLDTSSTVWAALKGSLDTAISDGYVLTLPRKGSLFVSRVTGPGVLRHMLLVRVRRNGQVEMTPVSVQRQPRT